MKFGLDKELSKKIIQARKPQKRLGGFFFGEEEMREREKLEKVLKKEGKAILGSGAECVVIDEGNERVLAIKHSTTLDPIGAKKEFYVHKILSTLFPHNFAKMYASFIKGEDNISSISGTIREKIENKTVNANNNILKKLINMIGLVVLKISKSKVTYDKQRQSENSFSNKIRTQFGEVVQSLGKTGMNITFDTNDFNFIQDQFKNIYYVDRVSSYYLEKSKKDQLIKFMKEKNYSETDIAIVEKIFDRIIALESEALGKEADFASHVVGHSKL